MWTARTLLIVDPNLGDAARSRLSAICEDLTCVAWDISGPRGRGEILATICERRWPLAISFYSDLILSPDALAAIDLPLNIHPARPCIRGVGHDIVPLIERHATVGATLHRMDPAVDTGPIFDVCEAPLPMGATYASVRQLNQSLSLGMLERLCGWMTTSADVAELHDKLSARAIKTPRKWGAYYSRKTVASVREAHQDRLGIDIVAPAS